MEMYLVIKHYQKLMSLMFNKHTEYERQLDMNPNKIAPSKKSLGEYMLIPKIMLLIILMMVNLYSLKENKTKQNSHEV